VTNAEVRQRVDGGETPTTPGAVDAAVTSIDRIRA